MLERITEWLRRLPKCRRLDSPTELSEICNMIPLSRRNCFTPENCRKMGTERTELYLTWYAKDSFFDCYHKKGVALLKKPWKSMVISPHEANNVFYLIFVDMCTLQHKIFNLPDKKSWKDSCNIMFDEEHRPAKLFTKYKHPFNSRDFESVAQSHGYVMCGWNSHKFLQKQIQNFKESYELVGKIKNILNHSRAVNKDLKLLQNFPGKDLPSEESQLNESTQSELEEDIVVDDFEMASSTEMESLSSKDDSFKTSSYENTRTDGNAKNRNFEQFNPKEISSNKKGRKLMNEKIDKMKLDPRDKSKKKPLSCSIIGSLAHFYSDNKQLRTAFLNSNHKYKIREKKLKIGQKWECILLDLTAKDNMFYFIFMDADSCYPQVMESASCDDASCIESCGRFLERHVGTKELHVPVGKPFDSEDLKNYLQVQGIEYYFNSPHFQYLKQPSAAFSVVKRIISRNYTRDKRSKVLSDFVRRKIIMRHAFRRNSPSMVEASWKGRRVLAVEMTNDEGNYLLFIDLDKALVEAYPKKPKGRFIFPQEMIVSFVQAFNELGIPKELHTIGGSLFASPEFGRLIEYCYIKHCSDCWHAVQGTRYFNALDKVKSCFARTSDVERGLQLWESLRKRLRFCKRSEQMRMRKTCTSKSKKSSRGRKRYTYTQSKSGSDSHLLSYAVGQTLWKVNDRKSKNQRDLQVKRKTSKKEKNLIDLTKRNKLKLPIREEQYSGRIDGTKYQKMLNKLLKRKEARQDRIEKPNRRISTKRKHRNNEKYEKNKSKRLCKQKKNYNMKLCSCN